MDLQTYCAEVVLLVQSSEGWHAFPNLLDEIDSFSVLISLFLFCYYSIFLKTKI